MDLAAAPRRALSTDRAIGVAILAMGGQGGGVLAEWVAELARGAGWVAQGTSVPGVAQRTGATVYYVEMIRAAAGRAPVLALFPAPGEVDVVVAAEWMEGGRAIMRGFVSPDRTVLVASTHRALAVSEKEAPGDGVAEPAVVSEAAGLAARRVVAFDMAAVAEREGSVISAALFGALAGSGALPFEAGAFEETIRRGGVGVAASLRAFEAARRRAVEGGVERPARVGGKRAPSLPGATGDAGLDGLVARVRAELPEAAWGMAGEGLRRLVAFQDVGYAGEYVSRLGRLRAEGAFVAEAARQLAVAMAYDDLFRVAELKVRGERFARVRGEMGAKAGEPVYVTEFMHPGMGEALGALPGWLGAAIERRPGVVRALDLVVNRGRRVRTGTVGWFVALSLLAGARRWRRGTLRHGREMAHVEAWLGLAERCAAQDPALGIEVLKCRRLVKGYADTHARGMGKFDRVMGAVPGLMGRGDAAEWVRRLREVALADAEGAGLEGALRTVASFSHG